MAYKNPETRKEYMREYNKKYYEKNKEKEKSRANKNPEYRKKWEEANKEARREYQKQWRKKKYESDKDYKDKILQKTSQYYHYNKEKCKADRRNHYLLNKGTYIASVAKRTAAKLKATPPWLSSDQLTEIEEIYWLAQDLKAVTGEDYHVDHIVPLQGENVSGLHVPWNLQILPSDINIAKGNKHVSEGCS